MHTIDIVSDVSCPWCVIGYRSLHNAIKELKLEDSVTISWLPFELNPTMPMEGQNRTEHLQQKYGMSDEQSRANRQNLIDRGVDVGYQFNFSNDGRVYNTFDAHRLLHWAKSHGLQTELKLALFDLYFQNGGNPSNHDDLLNCVKSVDLPANEAKEILNSENLSHDVRADQERNYQNGINAVPAFIFDNKYLVSGGQPKENFIEILQQLSQQTAQ